LKPERSENERRRKKTEEVGPLFLYIRYHMQESVGRSPSRRYLR